MKESNATKPKYVIVNKRVEWEPGIVLEGNWMGFEQSLNEEEKPIFFGKISNSDGFHRFSLSAALTQLKLYPAGTPIEITCIGQKNLSGGRTFKEFTIGVDPDYLSNLTQSMFQNEPPAPLMIEGDPFAE